MLLRTSALLRQSAARVPRRTLCSEVTQLSKVQAALADLNLRCHYNCTYTYNCM